MSTKIDFRKVLKKKEKKDKEQEKIKETIKKNEKVKEKKPRKRRRFRFFYWLLVLIVFICLCTFVAGVGFCYYIVTSAPEFDTDKMFEKEATRLFDASGNLFATLGTEHRQKVKYEELPQVLVDAIIATEDSRFFQHNGFDAPRFLKASISQVLGHGGGGASTLTMQLSKLAFTSTEASGIEGIIRKFTDIYMSVFKMEKFYTKEEIIEYYVNTPCLGGSIYGVKQASMYYFGKDVADLNLVEAAQIAGMFQSPNGYDPYRNPNDANTRKNDVLYLMKRHGYITDEEYKAGTSVAIKDFLNEGDGTLTNEYQGFIDTVVDEVIDRTGNNPYDVPMDIYTTMITKKQDVINNFYKTYKFPTKKLEIGVGMVDVKTGAIVAVGAGRDKSQARTLNVATFHGQTKRMPGSTAKPILDYGPAFEFANMSTYGPFIDDKVKYGGGYMKNFGGSFSGFKSMADCLRKSINTCALQAFRLTSNEEKYQFATSLGIDFGDVEYLPDSYSIGAMNVASPVILAGAYAAFGNGGYYTEPHSFTKIVYRDVDEEYNLNLERKRVMKATTAYLISSVLTGATTSKVSVSGTQVATKTGTTSYDTSVLRKYGLTSTVIPDSWVSSYTSDYAVAIWIGYPDGLNKENVKNKWYLKNSWASNNRLSIQAKLVNKLYDKNAKFKHPGGITSAKVELETFPAQSPTEFTPSKLVGSFQFISGTEPSEKSTRFAKLINPSGLTYNISGNQIQLSWTSPGLPSAVDLDYLTNFFKTNYGDLADKYLKKRLSYNEKNIGNFGYEIYLTSGDQSTYVDWTSNTSYTINTSNYPGTYDGVIVKSSYSIFKSNASDGYKVTFTNTSNDPAVPTIDPDKVKISMSGLNQSLNVGDKYSTLTKSAIDSITYDGSDIMSEVTSITVDARSITKEGGGDVAEADVTKEAGTYKVTYLVDIIYSEKSISKTITQTISVQ